MKRFVTEEYSIAELLDDPIAILLMKSDGIDRQIFERSLLDQMRRPPNVDVKDRGSLCRSVVDGNLAEQCRRSQ